MSWKKISIAILATCLAVLGALYAVKSSGNQSPITSVNPAFGEYIAAYTTGMVSSGSSIRVMLSKNAVDSSSVGTEADPGLFSFRPALRGKAVWVDLRTVEFRPDARMVASQLYQVQFALSRILEVPRDLSTFAYTFQVIPQNFELSIANVKPYVVSVLTRQKIEGVVLTADFAESEMVENAMTAKQEGRNLAVTWTHQNNGQHHHFTVEDVTRKEAASMVSVNMNGRTLGIEKQDEVAVEIPALGDFKVMGIKVEQSPSQHVVVRFSDPLSEKQNLEGLVNLDGVGTLDFEIRENEIKVFPPIRQNGSKRLTVEAGIRNILDYRMKEPHVVEITFEQTNPAVRFVGKGAVLPGTDGLVMPFEAVNLKSVDIEVIKVFERNVIQFFQVNDLSGNSELRRVGKPVLKKTINLNQTGIADLGKWNLFTLDLTPLIQPEPGAIYQVRIGFKKAYLAYVCDGGETNTAGDMTTLATEDWELPESGEASNWDSYEEYYYDEDYDWQQRDNPCHPSYYAGSRTIKKNVLASDLGLLAKRGSDGKTIVFVNDLRTAGPLSGVIVELYNYQQQPIGSATSDGEGKAVIETQDAPFVLLAKNGAQRGYLKVASGESLSVSNFDVGGDQVRKGLKGFLYGERGVWRPGDSLFLTFVLEDRLKLLPPTHPVVFELQDPHGQVTRRIVRSRGEHGFYRFATQTSADAPTGNWRASVKVGGTEFIQPIRIETIKPNRLKINLDFGVDKLTTGNATVAGNLQVNWLHGAPGRNLKATFEVLLTRAETKFQQHPGFVFDDPSRSFESESTTIFEGYTDDSGAAVVNATLSTAEASPGMLNAVFRGKAFEESGNFSIDRFMIPYYPYTSFTGIRLPEGDTRGMLLTDTTHNVSLVTVDADGRPVSRDKIEMSVHKLEWKWWWNSEAGDATYMSTAYAQPILKGTARTVNGKGGWDFKIKYPEWGRYLVKAYDPVSGHATGKVVYIDWPGWAGRSRGGAQGATMLTFTSDKPTYAIGEKATVTIPGADQGRALVSIENGSSVLQTYWVQTTKGDTPFSFEITPAMTPNVFIHVTLMQPHAHTTNDLPIRMYGIIPITVEDPNTKLTPVIDMPDVLEPGKEVVIRVSEKARRKMTYTIAVVDEGLLDITRFRTPDAWRQFYAREALGVKSWDLYDEVMNALGVRSERLLAIGGDMEAASSKEDDAKANRFKPVVKFLGPFTLSGGRDEHRFVMPQYIGSVKTMLVAGYEGAYGNAEKATPVRKPLMVLATLPRVLGPDERVKLPITLFSMEKSIRQVKVTIAVKGPLQVPNASQTVTMKGDDITVDFDLNVLSSLGVGKVEVTAESGAFVATDVIQIEIRNPNPPVTQVQDVILEAGKSWNASFQPFGMEGTNSAQLEISSIPPINLAQRLKYLLQYPYGCIEQTTSAVFPQLYLSQVKVLTDGEQDAIQTNVKAGIERLKLFKTRDGGFSYWPGGEDAESWVSTYAGHFLVEAEAKGYVVSQDMLRSWKKFQRNKAQAWRKNQEAQRGELIQAYRLYTLALAGEPELGAMNRLREQPGIPPTAAWMLAAAYIKAGQPEAGKKMIDNLPTTLKPYQELAYSYGSDLRDKAIILETLVLLQERVKGLEVLKEISTSLGDGSVWLSTHTAAWCLKSVGAFVGTEKLGELSFAYTYKGKSATATTELPVAQVPLSVNGLGVNALQVTSQSKGTLFVRLVTAGTPARGGEVESASNLKMLVSYTDTGGSPIDPSVLEQGTEFMATVSVIHPGLRGVYKNLALSQLFPSGWEINNLRLDDAQVQLKADAPTYEDIRDDRVYMYFDLAPNQQKTFNVRLTASFAGTYYLPGVRCEAMYDHSIYAGKAGKEVQVVKRVTQ